MVTIHSLVSLLAGNELIKECTTKHVLHRHTIKQTNNTLQKTHTSATLNSNIYPDQPSITASAQLCCNVLCWVKLMKVGTEIKYYNNNNNNLLQLGYNPVVVVLKQ